VGRGAACFSPIEGELLTFSADNDSCSGASVCHEAESGANQNSDSGAVCAYLRITSILLEWTDFDKAIRNL
jgi:hypothetical protein